MRSEIGFFAVVTVAALAMAAQGAVVINNSAVKLGDSSTDPDTDGRTIDLDINPGSDVVLLFGLTSRNEPGNATISVGGGAATPMSLLEAEYDNRGAQLWFTALGDVASTTSVTCTTTGGRDDWTNSIAVAFNGAAQDVGSMISKLTSTDPNVDDDDLLSFSTTLDGVLAGSYGMDLLGVAASVGQWEPLDGTILANGNDDGAVFLGSVGKALSAGSQTFGWDAVEDAPDKEGVHIAVAVTPVPEPATMSLLGLGGLVALRRRRRA